MITTEELRTTVIFGTGEKASIGLTTNSEEGRLLIQQLTHEGLKIGDKITATDIQELPKVVLQFTETASIDSLIAVLNKLKHNMEYPYGVLPTCA